MTTGIAPGEKLGTVGLVLRAVEGRVVSVGEAVTELGGIVLMQGEGRMVQAVRQPGVGSLAVKGALELGLWYRVAGTGGALAVRGAPEMLRQVARSHEARGTRTVGGHRVHPLRLRVWPHLGLTQGLARGQGHALLCLCLSKRRGEMRKRIAVQWDSVLGGEMGVETGIRRLRRALAGRRKGVWAGGVRDVLRNAGRRSLSVALVRWPREQSRLMRDRSGCLGGRGRLMRGRSGQRGGSGTP